MDMAGHVSRDMLKHYSHIPMEAKRAAVAALVTRASAPQMPIERSKPDMKFHPSSRCRGITAQVIE